MPCNMWPKFLRKLYFKYLKQQTIMTVSLRGRLSESEKILFDNLAETFLLRKSEAKNYFKKMNRNILEIGFGNGIHLAAVSKKENQNTKILGVEMYLEGALSAMKLLKKQDSQNVKVMTDDAREIVGVLNENTLDIIYVLFPDPWRKPRHNKRRILKSDFIKILLSKLKSGGRLIMATDWQEYAYEIESGCNEFLKFEKSFYKFEDLLNKVYLENLEHREITSTAFAQRAVRESRNITMFTLTKIQK